MNKSVALVTYARFPSEMAYGIHLIQIAKSFLENNLEVNVYYPKTYNLKTINIQPNEYYNLNNEINFVEVKNIDITSYKFYQLLPKIFQKILYTINTFLWTRSLMKVTKNEHFVWSTNPNLIWSLRNHFAILLYEKHGQAKYIQKISISKLKKLKNAFLISITKKSQEDLANSINKALYLPLGVDNKTFKPISKTKNDQIKIGYVGFLETHGVDKGVSKAVKEILKLQKEMDFSTTIAGGPKYKIDEIRNLVSGNLNNNFEILDFIPHKDVPNIISNFDIGIVPYPNNQHMNLYASPMKIFELASCGVPILASNIEGHLNLNEFELGIFYYQHDDFNDFREKLSILLKDESLRRDLKNKSLKNIKQLSFENRTKIILSCVRSSIG